MEKKEFKAGDIVCYIGDDNNRYKVLEVSDNGVIKVESMISGNIYSFLPDSLERKGDMKPRKRPIVDANGKALKLGDLVRHMDGNMDERWTVMELNFDAAMVGVGVPGGSDREYYSPSALVKIPTEKEDGTIIHCGKDGSGKDDRADHKPRWELLPLDAVEEIVKVYTMGAEKYADNAWKDIPQAYDRYKAALFRHITAYDKGERLDKESGLSHLAHAAWNAIAILWLDLHKDDDNG